MTSGSRESARSGPAVSPIFLIRVTPKSESTYIYNRETTVNPIGIRSEEFEHHVYLFGEW
jgi:hypothetical protein